MASIHQNIRQCMNCGETFQQGRMDKKFCNDACRIDFNNRLKVERRVATPGFVKAIQKILLKNYKIMQRLNRSGTTTVKLEILHALGFNFSYFTSYSTTKKGDTYHFCFDQGYLKIKGEMVLLVVQDSQVRMHAED